MNNIVKDANYMLALYNDAMSDGNIYALAQRVIDNVITFVEARAKDGFRIAHYCVQDLINPRPIVRVVVKMLKERGFKAKFKYCKSFNSCNIIVRW